MARPVRLAALVAGVLLLALGSTLVWLGLGARQALSAAESRRNQDRATAWAERLSGLPADAAATALARTFGDSDVRQVRLQPVPAGSAPPQEWRRPEAAIRAPRWFVSLLPIEA
ncbi:MAG: hypothetical protein KGI90_16915, partial [Burkholderiales bacterium]|nr:hypothetical protein [Burkholderiales bacterium]